MLRTSLWWARPGVGYNFMVSLCRVPFCVQLFVWFLRFVFLFFVLVVSFSQNRIFWFGFVFPLFGFYSFVVRLESGIQKNKLSSFKLDLIWFGYRGFFFLSHVISLWFCDVSKLRWFL